jgi:hypothetical protein
MIQGKGLIVALSFNKNGTIPFVRTKEANLFYTQDHQHKFFAKKRK